MRGAPRLRVFERLGRLLGFSPEGRDIRVWVRSRPGEEDAEIVTGTLLEVTDRGALIALAEPLRAGQRDLTRILAVPSEPGWGLDALWFTFIAVDAYPAHADGAERIGAWWIRLAQKR